MRRSPQMTRPLEGKVALVAGANARRGTRNRGRARRRRSDRLRDRAHDAQEAVRRRSDAAETIEETAALVTAVGGEGRRRRGRSSGPRRGARPCRAHPHRAGRARRPGQRHLGRRAAVRVEQAGLGPRSRERAELLRLAIDTHLITAHYALPLLIARPGGLLVEVTDGTAEYNADHYRLSSSTISPRSADRAWHGRMQSDLAPHGATAVAITPGWMRSEQMLDSLQGEPKRTGAMRPRSRRTSSSPKRPASSGARWPRWLPTPSGHAGTASRCRAAGWQRSMASPISTARGRTAGATCRRSSSPESRRMRPVIAEAALPQFTFTTAPSQLLSSVEVVVGGAASISAPRSESAVMAPFSPIHISVITPVSSSQRTTTRFPAPSPNEASKAASISLAVRSWPSGQRRDPAPASR